MKIELRNVKYAAFASQETHCFSATVVIDGAVVGTVSNEGHGGSDDFRPWELEKRLDAYAKTLPPIDCTTFGGEGTMPSSAEMLIGDLMNEWLSARDLKRRIGKKMLFTVKGKDGLFAVSFKQPGAMQKVLADGPCLNAWKQRHGCAILLNTLPFDEALKIFREAA